MTPTEAKNVLLAFARQYKDVPIINRYAFNGKQLQTLSEAIGVVLEDQELDAHFIQKRDVMSMYPSFGGDEDAEIGGQEIEN